MLYGQELTVLRTEANVEPEAIAAALRLPVPTVRAWERLNGVVPAKYEARVRAFLESAAADLERP